MTIDVPAISSPYSTEIKLNNSVNSISVNDSAYSISVNKMDEQIKEIWDRLNKTVSLVHNCQNCGARLEIKENHPVFNCKYCGSTYIIGSVQPNSRY